MAGVRCVDRNWGREKPWCCRGQRALSAKGEKGEKQRGGERVVYQICIRKNTFLGPVTGESRGIECGRFLQAARGAQIPRFLRFETFARVKLWRMLLGRRRVQSLKQTSWCRDPLVVLEENVPFPGLHLEDDI